MQTMLSAAFILTMLPVAGCVAQATDELTYLYTTVTENTTTYSGTIVVANPNMSYAWNGSFFDVRSVQFETSSKVTAMGSDNGAITYTQTGTVVSVNLGWQSTCSLGVKVNLTVTATKQGNQIYPQNFKTFYIRGDDIRYPDYGTLPATWTKAKANLTSADLVADPVSYYDSIAKPVSATFIMYAPTHPTQMQIGQVDSVPYPVNTANGVRIWIPTRLMAMGVGVALEFFKINPNYMVGLGTKENFAAGVVPPSAGNPLNPVVINGVTWYWPIVAGTDGPYQQETENFNDSKSFFPDLYPADASHDNYTGITADFNNPNWISAGICSAISITVTREYLNAIFNEYNMFMDNAADPWAELSIVDYAYNRGTNDFLTYKLFTTNKAKALASKDIVTDFAMGGFASHVQTVHAITDAMNKALYDIYDARISLADMDILFSRLRMFYGRGIPTDADWTAMKSDVTSAFNVLAQHWGTTTISLRYDFLTLLRVIKKYLPVPYNPRPTGSNWYYQVVNTAIPTAVSGRRVCPSSSSPTLTVARSAAGYVISFAPVQGVQAHDIGIYNAAGKLVKTMSVSQMPGWGKIVWNTTDNNGSKLANGLYFVCLRSGLQSVYAKMILTSF
jgi:FlgD Ig-like domain